MKEKKKSKDIGEKKEDLKGNRSESNNTNRTGHSKITKSSYRLVENAQRQINNWMLKLKKIKFWSKIWTWKDHNRNADWINNMKKEL